MLDEPRILDNAGDKPVCPGENLNDFNSVLLANEHFG